MNHWSASVADITDKSKFSWPVMAAIVSVAIFAGGAIFKVNALEESTRELRTKVELVQTQVASDRADAAAFRATIGVKLDRLSEDVTEIKQVVKRGQ